MSSICENWGKMFGLFFHVLVSTFMACTLSGCKGESREAAVSSRAARPLAPTPAVVLQKTEMKSEPCTIVPVEGGTVTLDLISSDVLRLQLRDTAGRPASFATVATLETDATQDRSSSNNKIAFYRIVGGFPEGLYAKIPGPYSATTSATLRMMFLSEYAVRSYVLQLRCPADVVSHEQAPAIRDALTSPAVHATAVRQFLSTMENLAADAPAEHMLSALDLMVTYLQNSAALAKGEAAAAFTEAADVAADFRAKVSSQGQGALGNFELFRDRMNEILKRAEH